MEDENKLDFNFQINLQRLCMIKISTTLWNNKETKRRVRHFFEKSYNRYEEDEVKRNSTQWNKLTRKVIILLKDLSFPRKLNIALNHVTKSIGFHIFNWTKYVTKILKFDIGCAQNTFWSHYGTIDKVKIFISWVEEKKLETSDLFNMACIFCLEEYIPRLWNEIPDEVQENDFYSQTIYTMPKYNIIAYWKNLLIDDVRRNFISSMAVTERVRIERLRASRGYLEDEEFNQRRIDWLYIFANSHSIEENMFRVSVHEGLDLGVEYFWNKLNDRQRERNIDFSMHNAMRKKDEPGYAEILIFFVTKMSITENISLLYEEFFVLEMLLQNWPWEEFFMSVFDRILQCYEKSVDKSLDNYDTKFFYLVQAIVDMMKTEFDLYKTVEGSRYQTLLHETWEKIPESVKNLLAGKRDWTIFSKLFNVEDFKSLALIINYEGFRKEKFSRRKSLISCIKSVFVGLESDRKSELVDRFVNEVGLDDEKIKLKTEFRSCL